MHKYFYIRFTYLLKKMVHYLIFYLWFFEQPITIGGWKASEHLPVWVGVHIEVDLQTDIWPLYILFLSMFLPEWYWYNSNHAN